MCGYRYERVTKRASERRAIEKRETKNTNTVEHIYFEFFRKFSFKLTIELVEQQANEAFVKG